MGMAAQAGGVNAQGLFEMNAARQQAAQAPQQGAGMPNPAPNAGGMGTPGAQNAGMAGGASGNAGANAGAGTWTCSCGTVNNGKFCTECAAPRPAEEGWTCSCGTVNKGKFCM